MTEKDTGKRARLAVNYDRAAWFYEAAASLFSTGQIKAAKAYQLQYIEPGDQVLFLGVGAGEDAVLAAQHGARVTCVDISQKMLDRVAHRLAQRKLSADLICCSALELERFGEFDVCAANFFLNVFRKSQMIEVLTHATRQVRPGGKLLIADVALPQGNFVARNFNRIYLKTAMASFWALGLVPWHENYDYSAHFSVVGLQHERTEFFRLAKVGPVVYQSIIATRTPSA